MSEVAENGGVGFAIVRQGYDVDEVEEFLVTQAEAWRDALSQTENRVAELEAAMESSRRREAALLEGLQTAAQAREHVMAETEREFSERRAQTEAELNQLISDARASAQAQLAEAADEAARLLDGAELQAARIKSESEAELVSRMATLETEHREATTRYAEAEADLKVQVKDLNAMRLALVRGLEVIADGGLARAKSSGQLLTDAGIPTGHSLAALLDEDTDSGAEVAPTTNGDFPTYWSSNGAASHGPDLSTTKPVLETDLYQAEIANG